MAKRVGVTKRIGETKPVEVTKCVGETKPVAVTKRVGETKRVATNPLFTEVYDLRNIFVLLSGDFCSYFSLLFFLLFNVYHLSNLCFGDLLTFPSLSPSLCPPPIPQRHHSASVYTETR